MAKFCKPEYQVGTQSADDSAVPKIQIDLAYGGAIWHNAPNPDDDTATEDMQEVCTGMPSCGAFIRGDSAPGKIEVKFTVSPPPDGRTVAWPCGESCIEIPKQCTQGQVFPGNVCTLDLDAQHDENLDSSRNWRKHNPTFVLVSPPNHSMGRP
jgi:hypothetical protein